MSLAMPLLRSYSYVKKPFNDGRVKPFFPIRVVGLCLEKAYKVSCIKGLSLLELEDLATLDISGKLEVKTGATWKAASKCTLKVREPEANLAMQICKKQRAWLHDLGVNLWAVDKPMGIKRGSFDLLGDMSQQTGLMSVTGMLWIELKVFAAEGCMDNMRSLEEELPKKLQRVHAKHAHIGSVLLVVAQVSKASSAQWANPKLLAKLYTLSSGKWVDISASGLRVGKGQLAAAAKPPVSLLWPKIEFHRVEGKLQGLFKHFLQGMGLASDSPGKRAVALNQALKSQGFKDKLVKKKIPHRPGQPVWMGTKKVMRALHKQVLRHSQPRCSSELGAFETGQCRLAIPAEQP